MKLISLTIIVIFIVSCSKLAFENTSNLDIKTSLDITAENEKSLVPPMLPLPIIEGGPVFQRSVYLANTNASYENLADATEARRRDFLGVGVGGGCTSSIIGPKTLLTAAHCVDGGGHPALSRPISLQLLGSTIPLNFTCQIHPNYGQEKYKGKNIPRSSYDIAMCSLENPNDMEEFPEAFFEVLDINSKPSLGNSILMTGYGCYDVSVGVARERNTGKSGYKAYTTGVADKKFRIGNSKISELNEKWQQHSNYAARIESHSFIDQNIPKLCSGDSGGPVFSNATVKHPVKNRRIIAINSGVGSIWSKTKRVKVVSAFTDLTDQKVKQFILSYAASEKVQICGIDLEAGTKGCRS